MSTDQVNTEQSQLLRQLTTYFLVGGVAGVIFGLVHWVGILAEGFTTIQFFDALFNTLFGVVGLICWRLLLGCKRLVVVVWGAVVVSILVYAFAVGRGFNIVIAVVGALIAAALVSLWRRGELV